MEKKIVKINEEQLRNMISESVKNVLNEIGDTPAGQWMLGRLAGRQQNRAQGKPSGYDTTYGRIKNTTTDAQQYAASQRADPYDTYSFSQGRDLENNDWAKDEDNANNYDQQYGMIAGYGDAMKNMIQYASKNRGKKVAESAKQELKEYSELSSDGSLYPTNQSLKLGKKRFINALKQGVHKLPVNDKSFIDTFDKKYRYNGWNGKDTHGQPKFVPLLKAIDDAMKNIHDTYSEILPYTDYDKDEDVETIYLQLMQSLGKSFQTLKKRDVRTWGVSDFRGR